MIHEMLKDELDKHIRLDNNKMMNNNEDENIEDEKMKMRKSMADHQKQ